MIIQGVAGRTHIKWDFSQTLEINKLLQLVLLFHFSDTFVVIIR
jgi:hypothetical protein